MPFDLSRSHGGLAVTDSAIIGRELSRNEHSQPARFKPRVQRGEQARVLKAATSQRDDSEARIRRDSRRERVGRRGDALMKCRGKLRHVNAPISPFSEIKCPRGRTMWEPSGLA